MGRMNSRERRLVVVLVLLVVMAVVGFVLSPQQPPNPEETIAYYAALFESAEAITIRSADGTGEPVTVSRADAPDLFNRFVTLTRLAGVSPSPPPFPPKYVLDVTCADGREVTDVLLGLHLDAPKQPHRGKLFLIPRSAETGGSGPNPVMVDAVTDHLDPEGAQERREARRKARQTTGSRMPGPASAPSPETPGR